MATLKSESELAWQQVSFLMTNMCQSCKPIWIWIKSIPFLINKCLSDKQVSFKQKCLSLWQTSVYLKSKCINLQYFLSNVSLYQTSVRSDNNEWIIFLTDRCLPEKQNFVRTTSVLLANKSVNLNLNMNNLSSWQTGVFLNN